MAVFNPVVLHQLVLPNGSAYTFTYNIYGEIDKVVYPTGGYEKFTHDQAPELSANFTSDQIGNFYAQANRGVYEQRISADGTEGSEVLWQYSLGPVNWTTAPDGTRTERRVHQSQGQLIEYGFDDPRAGLAYDERVLAPNNGPMLRRKLTEWVVDGTVEYYGPRLMYKTRNPRPAREVEIILDSGGNALAATTTYQYDADLNVIASNRYAFVEVEQATAQNGAISAIPTGSLVRTEETDYLTNDQAYRDRNLLSLPTATRVKNAAGTIIAQSQMLYDEAAYPLLMCGAGTGWSDPGTSARGNATTTSSWLDATNSYLQTHAQYDQCGNLRNAWDAKGNQAQIEYSSAYAYAYPTLTRTAIPDPAGQHGSNAAFVSTSSYDSSTGLVTSTVDANNITTTQEYNDVLNRPTRTVRASGTAQQSQTTVGYDDANHVITTTSDQNSYNDNVLKSQLVYDALGRTIETRQYEGGTNYIAIKRQYDSMGRAYKTSNPFRPWQSEVAIWTTSGFDALGRVTSVTTPDSAVVSTDYSGNTVTVTDQTGKARKSVTDALGRLKEVYEDPAGLNYLTSYSYDTLDSLITVNQGGQTPSFIYDSLKRLTSATNPESGTISYQYDANGNLTQKTDARVVVSTYAYDALNRNTSVSYTNDPASTPTVNRYYDGWRDGASQNIANSKGRLWQTETSGASGSRTTVNAFDALGRPTSESQQFYASGAWGQAFTVARQYNLGGSVSSQTYPSERTVSYAYDTTGRTSSFSGNLGDGVQKTYASEIVYSPFGSMTKEKFGTDTAIYNKLFYNSRGQLAEIREGPTYTGPNDSSWNRGAIINHYSHGCWGACGGSNSTTAMTDNNGNLKKQEVYVPNSDQLPVTNYTQWWQGYDYDSLNRLQRVHEYTGNTQTEWQQEYVYDAFGNRRIEQDAAKTYGVGVNKKEFTVNTANNRLGVPSGQSGTMSYDNAGNLTTDTYSGNGVTRVYDAENRMKSETQASNYVAGSYTYDGDGRRVRRTVGGVTTWQVYGMDGELIAEYEVNGAVTSPQKEYGYRNGQLLVTAQPGAEATERTNVALASNGATASASSSNAGTAASATINGDRKGVSYGQNGTWASAGAGFPQWLEVDFNGSKTIEEIDVFGLQDAYTSPSEPTETMTFSLYGPSGYEVQYWNGSGWVTVTSGSVTGNNKVWRKFIFAAITTSKIRVLTNASPTGWSELTEVEAWATTTPPPRTNVALASNGATASASTSNAGTAASATINGDRKGVSYGQNGTWASAGAGFPQWLQVDFNGSKTIEEIDVFALQDAYTSPSEPTETMTFSLYGPSGYEVQYWNPDTSGWVTVTGGSVTGNNKVWRKFIFAAITTSKIRVLTNASPTGWSELTEVEAWDAAEGAATSGASINYLVSDQLGTPRIIFDQTGSLATTKRHDYAPFGEELFNGVRNAGLGYTADSTRQKFTQYERDNESGLDYANARYYATTLGRFGSADPLLSSGSIYDPQTWNKYSYTLNNPLVSTDPLGLFVWGKVSDGDKEKIRGALKQANNDLNRIGELYGISSNEYSHAKRAYDSYGEEGVDNGLTVTVGAVETKGAAADTDVARTVGRKTRDNPTGQKITITFTEKTVGGNSLGVAAMHEGSHAADGSKWVASGFNRNSNPTTYQTEFKAFTVTGLFAEASSPTGGYGFQLSGGKLPGKNPYLPENVAIWDSGWKRADIATLRSANINKMLAQPKYAGGLYQVSPQRQGLPAF